MVYNEKYNRYIDNDFVVYRWDKKLDKLIQVKPTTNKGGYELICCGTNKTILIHRLIWETFVGEIPNGYQIDHINTIRSDNRLENLCCVTSLENHNNPLTKEHRSKSKLNNQYAKGKPRSVFGIKFKEHFNMTTTDDARLYEREKQWYLRHGKCRWE